MKNPDNGKIMFKIKIDATKSNIVDLSGNKLKSDYLSQVLEHQDDTIVNLLSFDYTKLNDSDGEIKLVSSSDLITVDGSNQVSGLKLSYNGVDVDIPKSDFILQDDKITIKATIKPFELFTVTGNTIEFIVTFTPGVDLTTSRNLSLANLATTKTFTHEDKVKPRVVDMRVSDDNNRLFITFSEEVKRSDFNDFTEIFYEKQRGTSSLYDEYKMNIDYFPDLDTATYELSEDRKTIILFMDYRSLGEYFYYDRFRSNPRVNQPLEVIFSFRSSDGKLTDTQGNSIETLIDYPVFYNLLNGILVSDQNHSYELDDKKTIRYSLKAMGMMNNYEGLEPHIGGDGTTLDGFYIYSVITNKRYPLNKTHLTKIQGNDITFEFKPRELMYDVIPDEVFRSVLFKLGYDPSIGNFISQYDTPYEPFLESTSYSFDCGPKPEIVDWKIESLDRIPDPSGVRDHISTDKITLTFNKVIKTIENINNIGEDISVTFKKEGSESETNFKTLTSLNVLPNLNLNETIENVEINGKEVSFNVDLAQLAFHSNDIDAGDIAELPIQIRRLKYTKNKTKIIDDFNETIGNYETTVGDTTKYTTLTRTPGNLTSCTYNQIDDNTGEFVFNFDDYITSFDYTKLKLDMNNTGYASGIEFMEDVYIPDFNSKTQRVSIKTKEVFDKNGIDTTDFKEFKLCFPIELVEFNYMYRLPSPNTPDRNYYCDMKHDFIESTRPFKLVDFEIKTVDNVPNDKETTLWAEEITLILNKNIGSVENLNKIAHNLSVFYSYTEPSPNTGYGQFTDERFYQDERGFQHYDIVDNVSHSGNKITLKLDLARIIHAYKNNYSRFYLSHRAPKAPYGIIGLVLNEFSSYYGGALIKDKYGNEIVNNKDDYGFTSANYPNDNPKYTLGGRPNVSLVSHRYTQLPYDNVEFTLVFDTSAGQMTNMGEIHGYIGSTYQQQPNKRTLFYGGLQNKEGNEWTMTVRGVDSLYKEISGVDQSPYGLKTFKLQFHPAMFTFNYMGHLNVLSQDNKGLYTIEVSHDFSY